MNQSIFKIFLVVFSLVVSTQAKAGILFEPYVAYEPSSALKLETSGSSDNGGKTSGLDLGLRLAYKFPMFVWAGLDYSLMSGGTFKGEQSANDGKVDRSNLYFDVGVNLPVLARVWAGYGLVNSMKIKGDSVDLTLKNGTNIKVGVGFTALPLVSINFEYLMHDYKDYESGSDSGSTSDVWDSNHKENIVLIGISAPFYF